MSIADEIDRLAAQRDSGRLSDAEFEAAKARLFAQSHPDADVAAINSLRRSLSDRWVGGVCGGLAKLTGIESWIIRLLFVLGTMFAT